MTHSWWSVCWLGLMTVVLGGATASGVTPSTEDWKLIWSDEFDYTGLPDPKKWGYEEGYVRNNEKQFYTKERQENARVENGMLILECRKDNFEIPARAASTKGMKVAEYTAGSITTQKKFTFTYGRIEVKAKIPQGKGVWPAIWMLGENIPKVGWPRCGETDVMEFVGKEPDKIHGTLHFSKDGKHKSNGKATKADRPWEDFHIYAVEWTPEKIDFYYDTTKYHSVDVKEAEDKGQNPYHKPFYILLNFAFGGSWGGEVDDSVLPQKFLIEYVRVYQKPTPATQP